MSRFGHAAPRQHPPCHPRRPAVCSTRLVRKPAGRWSGCLTRSAHASQASLSPNAPHLSAPLSKQLFRERHRAPTFEALPAGPSNQSTVLAPHDHSDLRPIQRPIPEPRQYHLRDTGRAAIIGHHRWPGPANPLLVGKPQVVLTDTKARLEPRFEQQWPKAGQVMAASICQVSVIVALRPSVLYV